MISIRSLICINTVEPLYYEVLGTMKITLLYQVSHYIRVKKQRNINSWDQQNDLIIRGFCYIRLFITRFHCMSKMNIIQLTLPNWIYISSEMPQGAFKISWKPPARERSDRRGGGGGRVWEGGFPRCGAFLFFNVELCVLVHTSEGISTYLYTLFLCLIEYWVLIVIL